MGLPNLWLMLWKTGRSRGDSRLLDTVLLGCSLDGLSGLPKGHADLSATIAHPTETIKCKLQMQLVQPENMPKQYSGPIDVIRQTVKAQGITGMWRGLPASFMYRSCFAAMFGGFEVFNRLFDGWKGTSWEMSKGQANFLAGGMASNLYWFAALREFASGLTDPSYG